MISSKHTKKLTLYAFPKCPTGPSDSGFCNKLETFLRIAEIPYELQAAFPESAPKGKLPFIVTTEGLEIADSDFIIRHLIASGDARDINAGLSLSQLATSRAWQAYLEEKVHPGIMCERFLNDENFIKFEQTLRTIPLEVRPTVANEIRNAAKNMLWGHGIGRHSPNELKRILTQAVDDLDIAFKTHDGDYFLQGTATPTEIDAIVYGVLGSYLFLDSNPVFSELVQAKPRLVRYTLHMTRKYFPEYEDYIRFLESKL